MVRLPVFENRPAASKLAVGLNGLEDRAQDTAARKPHVTPDHINAAPIKIGDGAVSAL